MSILARKANAPPSRLVGKGRGGGRGTHETPCGTSLPPTRGEGGTSFRSRTARLRFAVLVLAGLCAALPRVGIAQPPTPDAARRQMEQAEQARAAALAIRAAAAARAADAAVRAAQLIAARVAAEARLSAAQDATRQAADRLAALADQRRRAAARLEASTRALAPLLPLIERLSLYPAETLLAAPVPPEQALRGAVVLRGLTHALAARAARVTAEQAQVAAASQALVAAAPALAAAEAAQTAAAAALDLQIAAANADRAAATDAERAAAQRAAHLAARAATLRDLLARLEAAQRQAARKESAQRAAAAREAAHEAAGRHLVPPPKGTALAEHPSGPIHLAASARPAHQLLRPVTGPVIRRWGAHTPAGPATGVSWRAAPGARVVAPCSGKVLFAAPFHGYGQLLILDCGGGYDAVIAGFAKLDATVGDTARAGQPIGALPAVSRPPTLYMELRRDGTAVDPAPWLRLGA